MRKTTVLVENHTMRFLQSKTFRNFRGKVDAMGPLERRLMRRLWSQGELSVRAIHDAFAGEMAYTTVMTTLDRLHQKGLLNRRMEGRAYLYTPSVSEAEYEQAVARGVLDLLLERASRQTESLLSCIIEAVTERDRQMLDELDRMIQEKKRELRGKSRS